MKAVSMSGVSHRTPSGRSRARNWRSLAAFVILGGMFLALTGPAAAAEPQGRKAKRIKLGEIHIEGTIQKPQ